MDPITTGREMVNTYNQAKDIVQKTIAITEFLIQNWPLAIVIAAIIVFAVRQIGKFVEKFMDPALITIIVGGIIVATLKYLNIIKI